MSSQTYRLNIEVQSDGAKRGVDGLKTSLNGLEKDTSRAEKALNELDNKTQLVSKSFGALKGMLGVLGVSMGIGSIIQTADSMQVLNDQVRLATGTAEKYGVAMQNIERIAMANKVSLQSVGEMYVSNERALRQLGKSQEQVIAFTENVTKAMSVGGGSAEGQAAALTQLGQALASGVLRGDEFNSIAEQAPMIMELMADSLNVTTGELRKMAGEGKLTAEAVYQALTNAQATEKLGKMSGATATTVSGAMQQVSNQWEIAVNKIMNGEGGISQALAGLISNFAEVIPKVLEFGEAVIKSETGQAIIAGLSTAFGELKTAVEGIGDFLAPIGDFIANNSELMIALSSGLMAGATAYYVITTAMGVFATVSTAVATAGGLAAMATTALGTAVAFLTSPITLTVAAIAALVAAGVYLYRNWDELSAKAHEVWNGIKQWASDAWQGIVDKWNGFTEWFSGLFDGFSLGDIWDSITAPITNAFESAKSTIAETWESLKSVFSGDDLFSNLGQGIQSFFSGIIAEVEHFFIVVIPEAWAGLRDTIMGLFSGMPEPVQQMVDNVLSIFDVLVQGISLGFELWLTGASVAWNGITAIVGGAIDWIGGAWDSVKNSASGAWESIKSTASGAFDAVKGYASDKLEQAKTIVSNVATGIGSAWDGAKDGAGRAFDALKDMIGGKLGDIKSKADTNMQGVKDALQKGFSGAQDAVVTAFNAMKTAAKFGMDSIKAIFTAQLTIFASVFNAGFALVKNTFTTVFGIIKALVRGDMQGVSNAIRTGLSNVISIVKTMVSNIVGAFKNLGSQLLQAGRDAVQGFINGLTGKMGEALAKAREMASKVISTVKSALDIHSPSREMKKLGKHTADGMAVGIEQNTPKAVKAAQKMADDIKKTVTDSVANLKREIALFGNDSPIDALKYDISIGKYKGADTKELEALTAQKYALERNKVVLDEIDGIKEKIALVGKNELETLKYQLDHADKYKGISEEIKQTYLERTEALNQAIKAQERLSKVEAATADIAKNKHILANWQDKHAGLKYDLGKDGYDASQIEQIVQAEVVKEQVGKLQQLFSDISNKQVFATPNITANLANKGGGFDFAGQMLGQSFDIAKKFEEQNALLKAAREQGLIEEEAYLKQSEALTQAHVEAKAALMQTATQSVLGGITGIMKNVYGEQSKHYKAAFAMEKAYAVATILMKQKEAIAKAWASAPFPANLGAVASTLASTGALAAAVNAIRPVGQAHDGIMSVPKSGTWNLEKGERVLPKHTAKALDDKLNSMGSGGQTVIVNVTVNSDGTASVDSQAQMGKQMGEAIKVAVQQEMIKQTRQGGLLYGR